MSNSRWYHLFLHDAFGAIRSIINFSNRGKVCLVVASGGHVPLLPPPPPLLGPALYKDLVYILTDNIGSMKETNRFLILDKGIGSKKK